MGMDCTMEDCEWWETTKGEEINELGYPYRVWNRILNGWALVISWVGRSGNYYMEINNEPYIHGHRRTLRGAKNYLDRLAMGREKGPYAGEDERKKYLLSIGITNFD